MREIKFRGKRTDNDEMVFGDLLNGVGAKYNKKYIYPNVVLLPKDCHIMDGYEVDPETIGQYTGLKDKNGTDVYESDILRSVNHYENKIPFYNYHKVIYNSNYFGYSCINLSNKSESLLISGNCQLFVYIKNIEFEVIGNIYENPELLK